MEDLYKLEEIYKSISRTLRFIEDMGELSDFDLDNAVEDIYNQIDNAHTDLYGLIEERKKQWKEITFL